MSSPRRTRDRCCLCCSKGSTFASPDFGWVWVSEKAAKSAGSDARGSSSSVVGAASLRGSAPRGSGRGASDLDSWTGSVGSGGSAGAEPSVLAAGSFHIRGPRTANLPRSRVDAHCSLCAVRDAALASVIKGQIPQVPSGSWNPFIVQECGSESALFGLRAYKTGSVLLKLELQNRSRTVSWPSETSSRGL